MVPLWLYLLVFISIVLATASIAVACVVPGTAGPIGVEGPKGDRGVTGPTFLGVLPVESGGTNSSDTLLGGNIMISSGSNSIVEGTSATQPTFSLLTLTSTTDSTSIGTGSLVTAGGLGVAKKANFGSNVVVGATTDSSSSVNGALYTPGGIRCDKSLVIGKNTTMSGLQMMNSVPFYNPATLNYYEETALAVPMRDPATVGVSNVSGSFDLRITRIGSMITVWLNQVTFTDSALSRSNTVGSVSVIPERFRPPTYIQLPINTFNAVTYQTGYGEIGPDGTVKYIVDQDITSGKTWASSGNKIGGCSFTYTFF